MSTAGISHLRPNKLVQQLIIFDYKDLLLRDFHKIGIYLPGEKKQIKKAKQEMERHVWVCARSYINNPKIVYIEDLLQ